MAPTKNSITSFCSLKDCNSFEEGVLEIDGSNAMFARAIFSEKGRDNVIEFIHIPNTTFEIKIMTPVFHYKSIRNIVSTMVENDETI